VWAEVVQFFSTFAGIFSFSFLVALSGAMSPGPLLTYTIVRSVRSKSRGYLMGAWIITGHALLEMVLIVFLLLGFSFVLKNDLVVRGIGVAGGLILVGFGISIGRDVLLGRVSTEFLDSGGRDPAGPPGGNEGRPGEPPCRGDARRGPSGGCEPSHERAGPSRGKAHTAPGPRPGAMANPVVGGVLVSMANPYWWVWWATIGVAFMVRFEISLQTWPKLAAFFLGHEAGDLVWYLFVSTFSYFGLRRLNRRVYYGILVCCSLFMILFGVWLGASPLLRSGNGTLSGN